MSGCGCGQSSGGGDQYKAMAADGTALPIDGTRTTGTLEEARAAASKAAGGWVKKA